MKESATNSLKYLTISPFDEEWGIVVTTVGEQHILPKAHYPASEHPATYTFQPQSGRILNEYQLIYITEGRGFFESKSVKRQTIGAGTMILLFPGEWHSYYPSKESGWHELWIGFKGQHIDNRVKAQFFTKDKAILPIGLSDTIVSLYKECILLAEEEQICCQQIISSILLHILGAVYYKNKHHIVQNSHADDIINKARILMKEQLNHNITPQKIAQLLSVSYSWFRQTFKKTTGISPAQYQNQLLMRRAKELLTSPQYSISEIAFTLGFENVGQFSTSFRKKEGVTPSTFRKKNKFHYDHIDK